jgi:3-dehydroquinate dehydratase
MEVYSAHEHLSLLFKNVKGFIEIRVISKDKAQSRFFESVNDAIEWLSTNQHYLNKLDIYVGVNPRARKPERGGGRVEHIDECWWLFGDYDYKKEIIDTENIEGEIIEHGGKTYLIDKPAFEDFYIMVKEKLNLIGIEDATLIVDSGYGYHVYIRLSDSCSVGFWKQLEKMFVEYMGTDPQVKDPARILRLAGSINHRFSPIKEAPCKIVHVSNTSVDPEYLFAKLQQLRKNGQKQQETEEEEQTGKKLSKEQITAIANLLSKYWVSGNRHILSLLIAGLFYHRKYTLEDAIAVVEAVCKMAKDEEVDDRIRAVKDTWRRAEEGVEIAYKSEDLLLKAKNADEEDWNSIVAGIMRILKEKAIAIGKRVWVRKSENVFVIADPKRCVVYEERRRIDKDGNEDVLLNDTVLTAFPEKVVVMRSEDAEELKITFKTSDGFRFTLEGDIEEISSMLKKTLRVASRSKLADDLSLLISKMIELGLCEVQYGENVKGFVLSDNELIAIDFEARKIEDVIEDLGEALRLLNQFVELSSFNPQRVRQLAVIIKWFIVAPFNYVFKQFGRWIPHLYVYGMSDTGKTKTCEFLQSMWHDSQSLSMGMIDTPYRLGLQLSRTTLPQIVNEMDFEALGNEMLELWKNAVDGITVRSRYTKTIKSYGILCYTSNSGIPTNRAIRKRLVIINFDPSDSEKLLRKESVVKFEEIYMQRKKLRAIGEAVYRWMRKNYPKIKEQSWIDIAEEILKVLSEVTGIELPWIGYRIEEEEMSKEVKSEEIRAYIVSQLSKMRLDLRTLPADSIQTMISWLHYRKRNNEIVILSPLIREMRKDGLIVSDLRELSYYIPKAQYKAKVALSSKRVLSGVVLQFEDFLEWLYGLEEEAEEEVKELEFDIYEMVKKEVFE